MNGISYWIGGRSGEITDPRALAIFYARIKMKIIHFRKRTLKDRLLRRLFPKYRAHQDKVLREAIEHLLTHPDEPCLIEGQVILSDAPGNERT